MVEVENDRFKKKLQTSFADKVFDKKGKQKAGTCSPVWLTLQEG